MLKKRVQNNEYSGKVQGLGFDLVVQGANDPRVLQVESDELVAAVKENEVPVEYVVFPDEGHGFRNKENRITASEAYAKFLDTYLKAPKQ